MDTAKAGNASTWSFQLNKYGEIAEYTDLATLDAAVEELLNTMAKNKVMPVQVIDYTIDATIDGNTNDDVATNDDINDIINNG